MTLHQAQDRTGTPGAGTAAGSDTGADRPDTAARHEAAVRRVVQQYHDLPPDAPVRLAKKTSNLFRPRAPQQAPGLDVTGLDDVIEVDPESRTAQVGGTATYERIVDATLAHGLMPMVVPQLKTITLGGAVTGLGVESSSFRNGLPHESVREIEVLTGSGERVVAAPDGEHADLFWTFPNSYGTLGYALRVAIDLDPVHPFVRLRHVRFDHLDDLFAAAGRIVEERRYEGEPVDFLDGTVFTETEAYLTLGSWADSAPYTSDYTGRHIYYRSVRGRSADYLTVRDYLWRWDTDWFWCSRAFGAQRPGVRRVWPRRWLRSDVYWKIVRLENRYHVKGRIDRWRGQPERERVVQDVEIPIDRAADFLRWFLREVPIEPVWLCPLRLRDSDAGADAGAGAAATADDRPRWPLYPLRAGRTYVNIGFWSTVPIADGARDGDVNRRVERVVADHGGHKSLYSDAYYKPDEFWSWYGGEAYRSAKMRYDPQSRLLDLYEKAVKRK